MLLSLCYHHEIMLRNQLNSISSFTILVQCNLRGTTKAHTVNLIDVLGYLKINYV